MDHTAAALVGAVTFLWLGMVLAISFLETPLKFRAPKVTLPIGLGIGRIVFRALNIAESVLAVALLVAVFTGVPTTAITVFALLSAVVLAVQLVAIRPRLNRRTDRVLAAPEGETPPRSRAHLEYIGAEVLKVAALLTLGIFTLAG